MLTSNAAGDKEVQVSVRGKGPVLQFYEDNLLRGTFDTSGQVAAPATYKELPDEIPPSVALFEPPVLGVTFIGTSHGFDPKGRTTGFIIWINGEGILVDPPIQTPEFLLYVGTYNAGLFFTPCKLIDDTTANRVYTVVLYAA